MRNVLLALFLTGSCMAALAGPARAENDSWYEDDDSKSSSAEGYSRPKGLPSGQTSQGWGIGLRLGYAVPKGDAFDRAKLSTGVKGVLKPQIDITYGLDASLVLGVYVALGGGFAPNQHIKNACGDDSVDCRILLLESGLLAEYRILPGSLINPWVGVNIGVDRYSNDTKSPAGKASLALLGVGFGASLGADVQLGDFGLGPFFAFQVGRYMNAKVDIDGEGDDRAIDKGQRAYHYWLNLGVRLRYQVRP
jgi:hypothetical protein